jgi:hypothetical protein
MNKLNVFADRLTPTETAEILGVKPETLAVWRCTKRYPIKYFKIGSKVFYKGEDIKVFIESRAYGDNIKTNDEEMLK